jgi:hypothetical protein
MSLLDSYRRAAQRKREEIAKLQGDKARVMGNIARLSNRINSASQAASRTTSTSTLNSKMREIERLQKDVAREEKKIADIEKRIGQKQKEQSQEESKIVREEKREADKLQREAEKQAREHSQRMRDISNTLNSHSQMHRTTQTMLEEIRQLPEKIKVLFLASNPLDQTHLRLDEEVRAITAQIRASKHRDSVELVSCWAVQPLDILQALNEHEPAIVHFSGHGSDMEDLVFQDARGGTKLVSKDAIVQTMMAASGSIRLVFFNACYSQPQAEAVVQHVDAAIGMSTGIGDEAARIFAAAFYSAIGFGRSVKTAFEQARAALMLENIPEESTPELFMNPGISADKLVIVKPKESDFQALEAKEGA